MFWYNCVEAWWLVSLVKEFSAYLASFFIKPQTPAESENFDKAIELDSNFEFAYINRGMDYGSLKKYESAISDFDKTIELNPKNYAAYFGLGVIYSTLNQYERAIENFGKAIQLNPDFARSYYLRGTAYKSLGKTAEAEADFKKYEELTGQKP